MHIVSQMFKLEDNSKDRDDDSFGTDDEIEEEEKTNIDDSKTDKNNQTGLLSVNTGSSNKLKPGENKVHARAPSRDQPKVSDYIKYNRSTFH
jgi:hypothetical protein